MLKTFFFTQKAWLWPILAVIAITPLTPELDITIARHFYAGDGQFTNSKVLDFIFNYGVVPAIITAIVALIIWVSTFFSVKYRSWRGSALILVLTLLIGTELVINITLKEYWGRPRPRQLSEFQGMQSFRPFYQPNFFHQPEPSKSFPCGHCSMGFYFLALALVGRRLNNKPIYWLGVGLTLVLGGLLSWARIEQGGHFLSDVMISALIMWLTAYFCNRLIKD